MPPRNGPTEGSRLRIVLIDDPKSMEADWKVDIYQCQFCGYFGRLLRAWDDMEVWLGWDCSIILQC